MAKKSDTSESKPTKAAPIVDVAHPGKSAPAANSKSVIVTNRPMIKDPMMVDETEDAEQPSGSPATGSIQKESRIQPLASPATETKEPDSASSPQPKASIETADAATPKDAPAAKEKPTEADAKPNDAKTAETPKANSVEPATEAVAPDESADASDEDVPPPKDEKAIQAAAVEEAKHEAAIDKLADSKQYYLPIETVEKRRSRRFAALGVLLSLLLIGAWADIALDAGIISNSANLPHTHLFDQQTVASSASTPTFKTFVISAAKLSFRYPSDWQASGGSGAPDFYISVDPPEKTDPNSGITTTFANQPKFDQGGPFVVKYVHYQKLPHKIGGTVYLRELVYQAQDKSANINVIAGLTNDNTVTVDQQLNAIDVGFLNPSSNSDNLFEVNVFPENAAGTSRNSFVSVDDAKQFIQSSADYQQARAILLSMAPTKQ